MEFKQLTIFPFIEADTASSEVKESKDGGAKRQQPAMLDLHW